MAKNPPLPARSSARVAEEGSDADWGTVQPPSEFASICRGSFLQKVTCSGPSAGGWALLLRGCICNGHRTLFHLSHLFVYMCTRVHMHIPWHG